jgi:hypothetical protein
MAGLAVLGLISLASGPTRAEEPAVGAKSEVDREEPGDCRPPCRSGFMCKKGKCVSLCNPPCGAGERCVKGECELLPRKHTPSKRSHVGVLGAYHASLNESGINKGEVRLELGGPYVSLQAGPAFGESIVALRTAILGHIPFQPLKDWPFFLEPTISLGYAFGWLEDGKDGHQQDIFLALGLRLRYDVIPRLAVLLELVGLQINFVRLYSNPAEDVHRLDEVPVTWNLALGLAFLY